MRYTVIYHEDISKKDLPTLGKSVQMRVRKAIEEKLTMSPEVFGAPLEQSLRGYRKLRVGDYRVIFEIKQEVIIVVMIGHRSSIYGQVKKRI